MSTPVVASRFAEAGAAGITADLAAWITDCSEVPAAVREAARFLILDGLGCGLFGSSLPWSRIVADVAATSGYGPQASIWGTDVAVPVTQAPLANGTAMHAFEFDDLHAAAVLHGGAQVLPAALAVAQARATAAAGGEVVAGIPTEPVSDGELLDAVVVGLEVGARIGLATGAGQLARGFHPSPNTGTFSAAATAARLLHLPQKATQDALGIAGSFGGFLMAAQYGAMVKRVHPGRSSQAGVTAAMLAARGLTGIEDVLEAPYGGFASAFADMDAGDLSGIVQELGVSWEVPTFSVKAYPCCGSNHTSLEAWASLRDAGDSLDPDDIASITVHCSTLTQEHVGWPYQPRSVTAAQMNLQYCLAAAIFAGQLTVDQFAEDQLALPHVLDLANRVVVVADPEIDALGRPRRHTVRLVVKLRDGRLLEQQVDHARGSPHDPLRSDQIVDKYRDLASRVLPAQSVQEIEEIVLSLGAGDEGTSSIQILAELLASPSPRW